MTADGELYADEDWLDFAKCQLDKIFGEGNWRLDGSKWSDVWDLSQMDDVMEIPILSDSNDERIGSLIAVNKWNIEDEGDGKYVMPEPKSFKVVKCKCLTEQN
jgi:hypothetical protein